MIKLIMTDMDGTLLSSDSSICQRNLDAIDYARSQGALFGIATGRDWASMKEATDIYHLKADYMVLGNGAQFVDQNGHVLMSAYLDKEHFLPITDIFDQLHLPYIVFTTKGYYALDPEYSKNCFIERTCQHLHVPYEDFTPQGKRKDSPCMNLKPMVSKEQFLKEDLDIIKVESYSLDVDLIKEAKKQLASLSGIAYLSSFEDNVEVTHQKAQKGLILEKAIQLLGIKKEEVIVLGDGLNDGTMFDVFPYSYAPSNADNEIKNKAYKVGCHHDQGILGEAIDDLMK